MICVKCVILLLITRLSNSHFDSSGLSKSLLYILFSIYFLARNHETIGGLVYFSTMCVFQPQEEVNFLVTFKCES